MLTVETKHNQNGVTENATVGLTGGEAVRYMHRMGFVEFLPIFGDKYSKSEEDREQKKPIIAWKERRFTAEEAVPYAEKGYWVAVVPTADTIVIDIDLDKLGSTEAEEAKKRLISVYGNTLWVETKRGLHFYYRMSEIDIHKLGEVSGRCASVVWDATDYQKNTRYAIFSGTHRVVHPNPILDLPVEFTLEKYAKQHHPNFLMKTEGDRNNTLFSVGRAIRQALLQHVDEGTALVEAEKAVDRLNALMKEPLPASELRDIQNSLSRPDREDMGSGGRPFRNGANSFQHRIADQEEEMTDNPFTKLLSFSDLQAMRRNRQWFMHGFIKHGDVVLVAGAPKSGKSTFMRSIALSCVAEHHQPLLTSKGRVLWFVFEEHHEDIADRVALAQKRYALDESRLQFVVFNPSTMPNPLPYFIAGLKQLLHSMREDPPVAVIVDTVGRVFGNMDINDYTTVQQALENIRWSIRDIPNPPVIFLVHHTNKSEYRTPLGSQAFQGSADAIFTLDFDEEGSFMQCVGRNVDPMLQHKRIHMRFDAETMLVVGVGDLSSAVCELVEKIHNGEISLLKDAEKYQGGVFKYDLKRLLRRGILLSDGELLNTNPNHKDLRRYLEGAKRLSEESVRLRMEIETKQRGENENETVLSYPQQEPSVADVRSVPSADAVDSKGAEQTERCCSGESADEGSNGCLCLQERGRSSDNRHDGFSGEADRSEGADNHEGKDIHDAKHTVTSDGADAGETETRPEGRNGEGQSRPENPSIALMEKVSTTPPRRREIGFISIEELYASSKQRRREMRLIKNDLPLSFMAEDLDDFKMWGIRMRGEATPVDKDVVYPKAYVKSAWRLLHHLVRKSADEKHDGVLLPLSAYFPFAETAFQRVELPAPFEKIRQTVSEAEDVKQAIMSLLEAELTVEDYEDDNVLGKKPLNIRREEDVIPLLNTIGTLLEKLRLPIVFMLWLSSEPMPFLFTVRNGEWMFMPTQIRELNGGLQRWLELLRNGNPIHQTILEADMRIMYKGYIFHRAKEENDTGKEVFVLGEKRIPILDTEDLIRYLCYVVEVSPDEVIQRCQIRFQELGSAEKKNSS